MSEDPPVAVVAPVGLVAAVAGTGLPNVALTDLGLKFHGTMGAATLVLL